MIDDIPASSPRLLFPMALLLPGVERRDAMTTDYLLLNGERRLRSMLAQ